MRIGHYVWNIEPDEMNTEELEILVEGLQMELENKKLEEVENDFDRAFQHAYREGYKVFLDDKEISVYDLYIGTEAP